MRPAGPEPDQSEIDAGLAGIQAHGGRGERLLAYRARRAPSAAEAGAGAARPASRGLRPGPRRWLLGSGLTLGDGDGSGGWGRGFGRGGTIESQARRVDADELRADGQHVPDRAAEVKHAAGYGSSGFRPSPYRS